MTVCIKGIKKYTVYTLQFKRLEFVKEVSCAHQGCINLIRNTVKIEFISIFYNNCHLFSM